MNMTSKRTLLKVHFGVANTTAAQLKVVGVFTVSAQSKLLIAIFKNGLLLGVKLKDLTVLMV